MTAHEKLQTTICHYQPTNDLEQQDQKMILNYMERFKEELLTRENGIAHFTASGFILNEAMDKTLMVHHNIYNSWGWTGGHVDGEVDLLKVAIKEAVEETGVEGIEALTDQPQAIDIIPVWQHHKKGEPVSAHLHLNVTYLLLADESAPLTVKVDENSGVKWIPLDAVKDYCSEPQMMPIYNKLIERSRRLN